MNERRTRAHGGSNQHFMISYPLYQLLSVLVRSNIVLWYDVMWLNVNKKRRKRKIRNKKRQEKERQETTCTPYSIFQGFIFSICFSSPWSMLSVSTCHSKNDFVICLCIVGVGVIFCCCFSSTTTRKKKLFGSRSVRVLGTSSFGYLSHLSEE